jgi:hypothetical protein
MGVFDNLRNVIKSAVSSNGKGEITGGKMQNVLLNMVDEVESESLRLENRAGEASKSYTNDAVQGLKTYIDEKDVATFNLAKSYADDAIAAAITNTLNTEV